MALVNQNFLRQNPGLEAALQTDHRIVRDIRDSFFRFGRLSEKQIALVFKLHKEATEPKEQGPESGWVGEIGERRQFTLRLVNRIDCETQWGRSYLHLFTDEQGNRYKWFGSTKLRNQADNPVDIEAVVMVKATVKKHDLYNNIKQTALSRVKMV
jgi:hypothetical protein